MGDVQVPPRPRRRQGLLHRNPQGRHPLVRRHCAAPGRITIFRGVCPHVSRSSSLSRLVCERERSKLTRASGRSSISRKPETPSLASAASGSRTSEWSRDNESQTAKQGYFTRAFPIADAIFNCPLSFRWISSRKSSLSFNFRSIIGMPFDAAKLRKAVSPTLSTSFFVSSRVR